MYEDIKGYIYDSFTELFRTLGKKLIRKSLFTNNIEISKDTKSVRFKDELKIFEHIFNYKSEKILYHYTAFDSLLYILNSEKLKFSGVAGFNDANELRSKSTLLGDGLKDPFNKKRMNIINNRFAFCLSKRKDDLNQWRLYGDDGKGICLGFKLENKALKNGMYAGEVNYGETIIDAVKEVGDHIKEEWDFNFDISHSAKWGYFIKGYEWEDEEEVRVLSIKKKNSKQYNLDSWAVNSYGILYPSLLIPLDETNLRLSSITLGPKCPNPELNKTQISILLSSCFKQWASKPIRISQISSYR